MIVQTECDKLYDVNGNFRPRSNIVTILIAVFLVFPTIICPFTDSSSGFRMYDPSYGLCLESEKHGSALGGFYSFSMRNKLQIFVQGRILDIAGEGEFPVYDWYTGMWYKTNTANLLLLPFFGGVKFHPFVGKIANNFSPYVMCTAGPTVILDLPEGVGFVEQWKNLHTMYSVGGFFGVGIDFMIQINTYFSFAMGYDILPMGRKVDGRRNYSGTIIKFMIGKKRKS